MKLLGVLNLSEDSFSDGGRYSQLDHAIAQAVHLHQVGAWAVDVGAVSSNPDGAEVPAALEIQRLEPVVEALTVRGIPVSIDSFAPETQRWAASRVAILNDIRGFPDPTVWDALAASACDLIVMHRVQQGRADRRVTEPEAVLEGVFTFFERRIAELTGAGIDPSRLILDPGMGFFLGSTPEPSIAVLQAIPRLKQLGYPVLIGVSRKSFLGAMLGGRPVDQRGPATLAAELFALQQGADWIRTHDAGALADAHATMQRLQQPTYVPDNSSST